MAEEEKRKTSLSCSEKSAFFAAPQRPRRLTRVYEMLAIASGTVQYPVYRDIRATGTIQHECTIQGESGLSPPNLLCRRELSSSAAAAGPCSETQARPSTSSRPG